MYYAKVALRHLLHTFLALKWVKGHINDELMPPIVINFFLQWIDPDNIYSDEEVEIRVSIIFNYNIIDFKLVSPAILSILNYSSASMQK